MYQDPALKRALLAKGSEIAQRLEALLSKKEVKLSDLPPPKKPDEDPELRLRRFLVLIDRGIKSFGTGRFGRCAVCGEPIAVAALGETPWLESCPMHPPV
jgi:RNA polymerase-binding transcription factor DksA